MSVTRRRLAKRIEEAFAEQHNIIVSCDPETISFATGFYRTSNQSDMYRWTAPCRLEGLTVGPVLDSYDTATECVKRGINITRLPHWNDWSATAKEDTNV